MVNSALFRADKSAAINSEHMNDFGEAVEMRQHSLITIPERNSKRAAPRSARSWAAPILARKNASTVSAASIAARTSTHALELRRPETATSQEPGA